MTPPTLAVAREILADAAAKGRASGDPFAEIAAAAIDVVLAALEQRAASAVPFFDESGRKIGDATVDGCTVVGRITDARAAPAEPAAAVRVPVVGEGDGPPIGSALVSWDRATITMAVDFAADPAGRRPLELQVGPVSISYGPPALVCTGCSSTREVPALIAPRFEPVSDHRLREIAAGEWGHNRQEGKAVAAELLSARNALRYHEAHGRMRTNILNGEDTCIGCGKTAVLARHDEGDAPWLCGDCQRRRQP